ncbi:MAG: hypothetical protein WKF75_03260 [Singulisphaera sp.]
MMMSVKHMLDGRSLYNDMVVLYGPTYYIMEWMLHSLAGVPLTNDSARLVSIASWIATAVAVGLATWRMTRHVMLSALACMLTTLHLRTIVDEPGHPQEIVGLLLAAIVGGTVLLGDRRPRAVAILAGSMASALILTKINVGVYATVSLSLALLLAADRGRVTWIGRALMIAAVILLPWVLLRSVVATGWGRTFALIITSSVVSSVLVAIGREPEAERKIRLGDLLAFAVSGVIVATMLVAFALIRGATVGGIVDSLLLRPARTFGGIFGWPFYVPYQKAALLFAALGPVLAILLTRRWRLGGLGSEDRYDHILVSLKVVFALGILRGSLGLHAAMFAYGAPLLWLVLMPFPASPTGRCGFLPRLVACLVAALQPLQAYPVPGSQVAFGTFLFLPAAAMARATS